MERITIDVLENGEWTEEVPERIDDEGMCILADGRRAYRCPECKEDTGSEDDVYHYDDGWSARTDAEFALEADRFFSAQ